MQCVWLPLGNAVASMAVLLLGGGFPFWLVGGYSYPGRAKQGGRGSLTSMWHPGEQGGTEDALD